ncbi:MAG: KH domain-containing protein [Chloroflexota bacterium]|nr:KH domain-containing protein [Chloroflexota bacterium]
MDNEPNEGPMGESEVLVIDEEPEAGEQTAAIAELRGLVEYLATHLVDATDGVQVEAEQRGSAVHLTLRVPDEELGKVIGRHGRIARAIRTALMIAGARHNLRVSLDIDG